MSELSSTQALREPNDTTNNEGVVIQPEVALPLAAGSTHTDQEGQTGDPSCEWTLSSSVVKSIFM